MLASENINMDSPDVGNPSPPMFKAVDELAPENIEPDSVLSDNDSPIHSPPPTPVMGVVPTTRLANDLVSNMDLFELLAASQSDRMDAQRSSHIPLDILPTVESGLSNGQHIQKRRSSRLDMVKQIPLESVCLEYSEMSGTLEGIKIGFADRKGEGPLFLPSKAAIEESENVLIKPHSRWFVEDLVSDLSLADNAASAQLKPLDPGMLLYRNQFLNQDHMNFVGKTEALGGIVVSIRRQQPATDVIPSYLVINRSVEGGTQRIEISESAIPRATEAVTLTDLMIRTLPSTIPMKVLRQARVDENLPDKLVKVDECLTGCMGRKGEEHYKFGVLHCRAGQTSEEQLYNNDEMTPAFESLLDCIATKVDLKGHTGYSAGLDVHGNTTGTHSYYTRFGSAEIMLHVSTLLPFTATDTQQVARKRHIGNDCVTLIFQEADADPIDPEWFKSNFQEIFIVIRACADVDGKTAYRIQACWKYGMQEIFPGALDGNLFVSPQTLRKFVLTKAINAEHAWYASAAALQRSLRVRRELLNDIATSYATDLPVEGKSMRMAAILPDLARKITIRSAKKKHGGDGAGKEVKGYGKNATTWLTKILREDAVQDVELIISSKIVVLIDVVTRSTIHHMPTSAITGWSRDQRGLEVLLDKSGGSILILVDSALPDILRKLELHTNGCELSELVLTRATRFDNWGFMLESGIVVDLVPRGIASQAGLTITDAVRAINGATVVSMSESELREHILSCGNTLHLKSCSAATVADSTTRAPSRRLFGSVSTVGTDATDDVNVTKWENPCDSTEETNNTADNTNAQPTAQCRVMGQQHQEYGKTKANMTTTTNMNNTNTNSTNTNTHTHKGIQPPSTCHSATSSSSSSSPMMIDVSGIDKALADMGLSPPPKRDSSIDVSAAVGVAAAVNVNVADDVAVAVVAPYPQAPMPVARSGNTPRSAPMPSPRVGRKPMGPMGPPVISRPVPAPRPLSMRVADGRSYSMQDVKRLSQTTLLPPASTKTDGDINGDDMLARALRLAAELTGEPHTTSSGGGGGGDQPQRSNTRLKERFISETDA